MAARIAAVALDAGEAARAPGSSSIRRASIASSKFASTPHAMLLGAARSRSSRFQG